MLYLLLFQRLISAGSLESLAEPDYAQAFLARLELVPFRTIIEFIGLVETPTIGDLAFRNLVGNIVLFVPIGIFLPLLFRKQRSFRVFLPTTVLLICAVEITQIVTLLGTCDVDDLILNTAGACAGYAVFRSFVRPQ